jgi:predicted membrane metal-binding protein
MRHERYIFSANYALAALGIVVSLYVWPRLRTLLAEADRRIPALPVLCWTMLILGRLLTGGLLPRIT